MYDNYNGVWDNVAISGLKLTYSEVKLLIFGLVASDVMLPDPANNVLKEKLADALDEFERGYCIRNMEEEE